MAALDVAQADFAAHVDVALYPVKGFRSEHMVQIVENIGKRVEPVRQAFSDLALVVPTGEFYKVRSCSPVVRHVVTFDKCSCRLGGICVFRLHRGAD